MPATDDAPAPDVYRLLPDGTVLGLWSDAADLPRLGHVRARRGSAVHWDARRQGWIAVVFLTGDTLGPFPTRQAAVDAERRRLGALLLARRLRPAPATGVPSPGRPGALPPRHRPPAAATHERTQ
jgi:hypothetical protein